MKKITNRAKQAHKTKKRIYDCGIFLIRQKGYDEVTIGDIANKADVSIGTFYHYFSSKSDLLAEIFNRGDIYFQANAEDVFRTERSDIEKIVDYFGLYVKLSIEDGLERVKTLYVPTNQVFVQSGRAMQCLLTAFIAEAQARGTIENHTRAERITNQLFVAARGVVFDWCIHNGDFDLTDEMKDIISRLVKTYKQKELIQKELVQEGKVL